MRGSPAPAKKRAFALATRFINQTMWAIEYNFVLPPPSTRKPPTTQKSPGISSTSGQTSTTNKTGSLPPGTLAHRFSYSAGILFLFGKKKKEGGVNRHQSCRKRGVLHRSRDFVRHRPRTNAGVPNWFQSIATTTSFWKGKKSRKRIIGKSPFTSTTNPVPHCCANHWSPLFSFFFSFSYAACRPTNPSAPNKRWAKKWDKTDPSPNGFVFAPVTKSDTMPNVVNGVVQNLASKCSHIDVVVFVHFIYGRGRSTRFQQQAGYIFMDCTRRGKINWFLQLVCFFLLPMVDAGGDCCSTFK